MRWHELAVPGAWVISPELHADDRGALFEWFTDGEFGGTTGRSFDLRQANFSISAAGVLRGLHFAELPPGQAKYVTCAQGAVFDVVVDIRVDSPTYGRWDSTLLDDVDRRTVFVSEGLAHGFLALQDDSTVIYLCSAPYTPDREHTISPFDPAIGIAWPLPESQLVLSERDATAPTLAEARAAGRLPSWRLARTQGRY